MYGGTKMKKDTKYAFRKDIYLLGQDEYGENYWLEAPSWDCSWYWGFGYVETYTNNNNPERAKDISMHSHIQGSYSDKKVTFDTWCNDTWTTVTFDEEERAELSFLFNQFYKLKKSAEEAHRSDEDEWDRINKTVLPKVMDRIIEILTP